MSCLNTQGFQSPFVQVNITICDVYVLSRHKPWYGFYFSVKLRAVVVWTWCSYLASPPLSTKDTLIMMKFADCYQAAANMCSYVVCRQNRIFPFACGWGFIPTAEGSIYNCVLQLRSSWWCSPRVKSHICNWLKASGCSDSCLFSSSFLPHTSTSKTVWPFCACIELYSALLGRVALH